MTEITTSKLSELAKTANEFDQRARKAFGQGLNFAKSCGEALNAAKGLLAHGEFQKWIENNCSFTSRTGRSYMRVFDNWDVIEKKRIECPEIGLTDAIEMLTATSGDGSKRKPVSVLNEEPLDIQTISTDDAAKMIRIEREPRLSVDEKTAVRLADEREKASRKIDSDDKTKSESGPTEGSEPDDEKPVTRMQFRIIDPETGIECFDEPELTPHDVDFAPWTTFFRMAGGEIVIVEHPKAGYLRAAALVDSELRFTPKAFGRQHMTLVANGLLEGYEGRTVSQNAIFDLEQSKNPFSTLGLLPEWTYPTGGDA